MDPITMILSFALNNPQATGEAINNLSKPGEVDVARMKSSAADFARETLTCYHKTARFLDLSILGGPWQNQAQYGAENSVVMRIDYSGISGTPYQMTFAAMVKDQKYRTAIIQDTALIPYSKKCKLEYWVTPEEE